MVCAASVLMEAGLTSGDGRRLSKRQIACLELAAEGKTSEQIAEIMGISVRTVDQYLGDASLRLNARNRTHAVALAINGGLIVGPRVRPAAPSEPPTDSDP